MDRVFKRTKRFDFFVVCYQQYFYTLRTDRIMKMNSFNFLNYHRRDVRYTGQRVHKIKLFIPVVISGARNGLLMALFIPWVLHIMTYIGRLRVKGVPFLGSRYIKEQRFHQLKYMKAQKNASFRSLKRPKRNRLTITLFIFPRKKTYFAQQDLISSFTFIVTSESL